MVALISGAGRGIGRATAELFAHHGAKVVLCSRTREEVRRVLSAIHAAGGEAVGRVADISSPAQAKGLIGVTMRRYGRLDVLINNAGILGPRVPLVDYPHQEWSDVLRINLTGTFYLTQEAARVMTKQGDGCIIILSSSVGRSGREKWGAYAVSKFGVEGLSQVLADELRSAGVAVFTFNPGATRTTMRAAAYPSEDAAKVQDPSIVAHALWRLATRCSPAMSGRTFDLQNVP